MRLGRSAIITASVISLACGASTTNRAASVAPVAQPATPAATATASAPSGAVAQKPVAAEASQGQAHQLVIAVAACWLGGVWSDAEDVPEETRGADAERRCHEVMNRLYGSDDKARYERLRALDVTEVAAAKERIMAVLGGDSVDASRSPALGSLFDGVAAVERENLSARRAADRVKKDIDRERTPGKLSDDVVDAVGPLSESKALLGLLELDAGALTHEARAFAILAAMDRMEIARGLPKHLKVYALERPFGALFSVPSPEIPRDAHTPLKGGVWLDYISSAAESAGHPVPLQAKSLTDRELLAWGGALAGLADKLGVEAAAMSSATELQRVATAVVQRLENEYHNSQNAVRLAPEPAGPPRHLGHPSL
ncbi:MAG TPA: hypothetical protein VHC69_04000 [Polyangiaceae bacterium]|nr:hypothetical protein [Polyangiaceae bacterium]